MPKMLAIDDKQDNLITVSALLRNFIPGCTVITSDSGAEGIKKAEAEQPDTILLDIKMPEMDGYEVCRHLKSNEETKHIPVVMLTAIKTDSESRVKGLDLGADAFLSKPINEIELAAQVKVMLRVKTAEDLLRREKGLLEDTVQERTRALRESEERYRLLIENQTDMVVKFNREGELLFVSPSYCKTFDKTQDELLGKKFMPLIHDKDRDAVAKVLDKVLRPPYTGHVEERAMTKDGWRWQSWLNTAVLNEGNGVESIVAVGRDINDRKLAEEALKTRDYAIESSINGINFTDLQGDFLYANNSFLIMWGFKTQYDLKGRNISDLWADQNRFQEAYNEFQEKGSYVGELMAKKQDGTKFDIQISANTVKSESGEPLFLMASFVDITQRNQAQEALRESEEKYRGLIEGLDEAIYRMSLPDGKYEYMSPAAKKVFGYSAEEFIENPLIIGKLIHPDFAEYFKEKWTDLIEHKVSPTYKYKILDPEGNERWIVQSNTGIFDDSGNIIAIEGLCRDITKGAQAEMELQESEEKFRTFTEMAPVGVFVTDTGGLTTYWNKRLCEITGMRVVDGLGTGWADGVHPDDRERVFKEWYESTEKRSSFSCEYRFVDRDGAVTHTIGQASPMTDASKQVTGYVGTITDVTDLKQAEEALRESEEKYRSMMESMDDLAYICSPDYHVEYMNPAMVKRTGRNAIGELCFKVINGLDDKCSWCVHDKVQQGENCATEIVSPKDGRIYNVSHSPLHHADDSISKLAIYRDITEMRNMEQQLREVQKMEAIATLAGGIAHEFNNTLMGIMGNIELLKMNFSQDEGIDKHLESMKSAGHRMSRLTDQLLAYAEGGKYQPKNLKIDDFVIETLPILEHDLNPTVRVEPHFQKDISFISADNAQMQMVLSAILANSNEAIEDEGIIRIAAENKDIDEAFTKQHPGLKPGSYVCLTIEDDGKGMDEETRNGIFEPFFTTKFQGRGMGMAAVYGIVRNHNGWISVDSEVGRGTKVQIYLPAIEVEIEKPKKVKVEVSTGSGTILMIEDEDVVVEVTQAMLEMLGYRVMVAKTGKDAIHIAETFDGQIDLALLDIKLPDIDGRNLYPLIMKARPDLKVVVFSGYSIDGPAREILDAGAQDFIQKPFSIATLSEKLKEVLEGK